MSTLYLIPARGGSKGVPGKNIRNLAGAPLIVHSIRHALSVAPAEDIVVSTDSEEIADISAKAGATVPFIRPPHLATDTAGSREVMLHAIDFLNGNGADYDTIVLLQPTSPLRNPEDIVQALRLYYNAKPDMVVSVTEADDNPYYNLFETDPLGYLHISKGPGTFTRRQDAPKVWKFNGAIYVISIEALRNSVISNFKRIIPMPIPKVTAIDIDTELDFLMAEHIISTPKPVSDK